MCHPFDYKGHHLGRCEAQTKGSGAGYPGAHRCSFFAAVTVNGKRLCMTHVRPVAHNQIYYRADCDALQEEMLGASWTPSIHMPRWASRLTLEVTDVRIERVQDISREDEVAEGTPDGMFFDALWDSLNAKRGYPWDANPWVIAVTFKAHHCNVDSYCGASQP